MLIELYGVSMALRLECRSLLLDLLYLSLDLSQYLYYRAYVKVHLSYE